MSWQLITLTPEASTWAMLMLGFGGFGLVEGKTPGSVNLNP
jgi:hypothetical protein